MIIAITAAGNNRRGAEFPWPWAGLFHPAFLLLPMTFMVCSAISSSSLVGMTITRTLESGVGDDAEFAESLLVGLGIEINAQKFHVLQDHLPLLAGRARRCRR